MVAGAGGVEGEQRRFECSEFPRPPQNRLFLFCEANGPTFPQPSVKRTRIV